MMSAPTSSQDDQRQRAVISEHLPSGYGATFDGGAAAGADAPEADTVHVARRASQSAPDLSEPATEESSLLLHGGDIHRDLFKLSAPVPPLFQRSKTVSHPPVAAAEASEDMTLAQELRQTQGFRRDFVRRKLRKDRGLAGNKLPFTRNFIEFLDLYGQFAGEDLAESEEETTEGEDEVAVSEEEGDEGEGIAPSETRPLLERRVKSARTGRKGDAGMVKAFFTTLKAFIGTGIMFLPKAFNNGGILFSSLTLISVAIITMLAFHLLLRCRAQHGGGGYGDLGRAIVGPRMRDLILTSITLSQLGFVCTGFVFVADNWFSVLQAVTHGANPLSAKLLIAVQAVLLIPLAFIRNISKLGPAALLADVFIAIGVGYIWYYDIAILSSQGIHRSVVLFNPSAYTLTIGASIFTFEGIGLILPIQDSMMKPDRFEPLLGTVMGIITCIFTGVGALCYATFGSGTQIEVINNFPQDNKFVNAVQSLYALAVLVGNPVQLFPAMRIMEGRLFGRRSGKRDAKTKWKKNAFRTVLVVLCGGISIIGSENLDRFVALIGSLACVPLVYIYPPFLHYKSVAKTRWEKGGDVVLMVVGVVCMIYTTVITLANSFL